ncbi:putative ABC transporter permease [Butyrivibrio sp. AE3004]|uniref:putative ABC transporter permease n=1 Tax=Butyrivibrio sp. AE3004 TaxID=1506994 RepID=UPI0004942F30|nr:putative ABC transporter permease [Butyrivibrio sp. AE3004]
MIIAQYFVEFIFYSFLGWVWESIYCSVNEKKWADRGFLFGPICPIYGSCVVATSALFGQIDVLSSPDFPIWGIFLICYIGSAIAEFGTSWVLEKRFHARWWDYSTMPLNIQGRICVPVSIAFGLAGVAIVKYLIPTVERMHTMINPGVYEFLAIILAMLFGADYALTEASLSALLNDVNRMHEEFIEKAQFGYERVASAPKRLEQKVLEGKELASERHEQLAKEYAEKLSLNQKRILLGIAKFMPKANMTLGIEERERMVISLKEKVRELRGRHK